MLEFIVIAVIGFVGSVAGRGEFGVKSIITCVVLLTTLGLVSNFNPSILQSILGLGLGVFIYMTSREDSEEK